MLGRDGKDLIETLSEDIVRIIESRYSEEMYDRIEPYRTLIKRVGTAFEHKLCRKGVKREYYEYIPFNPSDFIVQLEQIKQPKSRRLRFLDVGCGIGITLSLAESLGFIPTGIEYNPEVLKYAILQWSRWDGRLGLSTRGKLPVDLRYRIALIDALRFDRYEEFDVVYLYCPIRDPKLESKLERLIEDSLKPGAYYICNGKRDNRIEKDSRFRRLEGGYPIWQRTKVKVK